jgi:hypothetical protein
MGALSNPTSIQGAYDWLLLLTLLFAALLGLLLLASHLGVVPPIDRLDGGGAVVLPLV